MKYHCGHLGCDICGSRQCAGANLNKFAEYIVCHTCIIKAIKLAIHVTEDFSTYIDPSKRCGNVGG